MIFLSREVDYAVRALAYMAYALKDKNALIQVETIAEKQELPHALLRSVLQKLAKAGIIRSVKGKNGGVGLLKSPAEITIADLIPIFQTYVSEDTCYVGQKRCSGIRTCKLRCRINAVSEIAKKELAKITIESLL